MSTTLLYAMVGILMTLWAIFAVYVFLEVKKTYVRNGMFTNKLLQGWFTMWGTYISALVLSSWYGVWLIPISRIVALISGFALISGGVILLVIGIIEFRTLRRSCAQDTSKLITSGIYKWSRNPQFIGCLLYLVGIALAGRSMFAFALTAVASIIIYWYTVYLAEPYLERLYGEEYRLYKQRTSRWIGIPIKNT